MHNEYPLARDQAAMPMLQVLWETMPRVRASLDRLEPMLYRAVTKAASPAVQRVGLHLIQAGGKRLRPMMLLLAGDAAGGDANSMVDLAAVVELLHVASLHHDDIMDEAPLRRGLPSANALWGNRISAMAGSYLVTRAMELLAQRGSTFLEVANDAVGRLWRGQMHELEGVYHLDRTEQAYLAAIADKTAALYELPCALGALAAGARPDAARALSSFGHNTGMAFQVVDDLLDLLGTQIKLGKLAGADMRAGVYTLPVIRAMADHRVGPRLRALLAPQAIDNVSLEQAVQLVRESCGLRDAAVCAQSFVDCALDALAVLPRGSAPTALQTIATAVMAHPELLEWRGIS